MRALLYTARARADLRDIWDYTEDRWDEDQADAYVRRVTSLCDALADGSHPGTSAEFIRPGLFKATVGMHVVFYRELSETVTIVRVLHQRMNAPDHLD